MLVAVLSSIASENAKCKSNFGNSTEQFSSDNGQFK